MSAIERIFYRGIRCNKPRCDVRISFPDEEGFLAQEAQLRAAHAMGWTTWVSRSRVDFCPDHKPSPGSKYRQVTS